MHRTDVHDYFYSSVICIAILTDVRAQGRGSTVVCSSVWINVIYQSLLCNHRVEETYTYMLLHDSSLWIRIGHNRSIESGAYCAGPRKLERVRLEQTRYSSATQPTYSTPH